MPRPTSKRTAIPTPKPSGSKIKFAEDFTTEPELSLDGTSSVSKPVRPWGKRPAKPSDEDDEEEEESGDEAPEAVGLSVGKKEMELESLRLAREEESRREAARKRGKKIAAVKTPFPLAAKGKGKGKVLKVVEVPSDDGSGSDLEEDISYDGSEGEDSEAGEDNAETRRLEARMKAAMEAGDGDSEDDVEDGESFHTDSEGDEDENDLLDGDDQNDSAPDDEDEDDDEGGETDDSEDINSIPIDAESRKRFASMQAVMEAAERRAGLTLPTPSSSSKSITTPSSSKSKDDTKRKSSLKNPLPTPPTTSTNNPSALEEEEDDEKYNLTPVHTTAKPLPKSILAKAAATEANLLLAQQSSSLKRVNLATEEEGLSKRAAKRLKAKKDENGIREVGGRKLQVLKPVLTSGDGGLTGGMPPVIEAGRLGSGSTGLAGKDKRNNFYKRAMKVSGVRPGMGMVDGRRK